MRTLLTGKYVLILNAVIIVKKLTKIKIVEMCAFPDFIFVKISTRFSPFF
jgi:hypothetical protein